jgi:uncharacterized membrane protein
MTIGSGIALIVIGAILAFAINIDVTWIDLVLVGGILMGAGAVAFVLGVISTFRTRQSVTTVRTAPGRSSEVTETQRSTSES